MIWYLPIEHEEMRYTAALDSSIRAYLHDTGREFRVLYPDLSKEFSTPLPEGCFLNAPKTIAFKSAQLAQLALAYATGSVESGDTVFLGDMWFPGIEAVRYLDFFCKKNVKLVGILHAGSFTDTDFVRQMERWACLQETTWFSMFDKVIVASEFMKRDVCSKRLLDPSKVVVSPFPLDPSSLGTLTVARYQFCPTVLFNGRLCAEKQPELFTKMETDIFSSLTDFVKTQSLGLTKEEYYDLLKRSQVVVSFALQENFGFGIAEAVNAGCFPVVPNRLVYPEFYPAECLYNTYEEACSKVRDFLRSSPADRLQTVKDVRTHLLQRIQPKMDLWFS